MRLGIRGARYLPLLLACGTLSAQQLIGYVNTHDAETTGASDELDGQAVLTGSASVTAKDHTAPITLGRGGMVRVCQTSAVRLTESKGAGVPAPLLFSLDRGAIEIQTDSTPNDSILTPDLRFVVHNSAPLDLRLRIARNGDTCVDNRGVGGPTLAVSDPFGESAYEVGPGQHVLFEHGSLHEVVDNESSPCGCPAEKGVSVADALLAPAGAKLGGKSAVAAPVPVPVPVAPVAAAVPPPPVPAAPALSEARPAPALVEPSPGPATGVAVPAAPNAGAPLANPPGAVAGQAGSPSAASAPVAGASAPGAAADDPAALDRTVEQAAAEAAARAAALHPFPEAVSEGLASPAEQPPVSSGEGGGQITTALSYTAPAADLAPPAPAAAAPAPVAAKAAPERHGAGHAIGRFFRRLFGR